MVFQPSPNKSEPMVTIRGLGIRFPKSRRPALDHVDAEIWGGRMTGLVGPDGAGKTTLIRIITGLLIPSEGELKILGFDPVGESEQIHRRCGYMPQRFGLYEDLNVMQNLRLYADLRGVLGDEREQTFARLLEFTDLKRFTGRKAGALSGGMKQKLGLACALLSKPTLLLLDEPSVGVDPISRRDLWKMVQELVSEGIGVLWSTAYLEEADLCDQVILLNEGKKLFSGAPKQLTKRVESRTFTMTAHEGRRKILARALQDDSVMDGVVQGEAIRLVFRDRDIRFKPESVGAGENTKLRPVPPRFEDAFIDVLGGSTKGESPMARVMKPIPGSDRPAIECRGLTKRFGDFLATDRVTFSVQRGEIFGLLGPNGAGKSTTFKMLCGLLPPSAGAARVAGFDLQEAASQARNRLGYMAQKFSLYGNLTVGQNLEFFSGIYGLSGGPKQEAVVRMVEIFGLQDYLGMSSGQLPLGFKQRLAMACSLMHEPDVLFLDEPTSGVDPIARREFWTHINALVEKGRTVLVTTHFMDEAEYCDRIALIYHGKVIALGTPDELKRSARTGECPEPTMEDAFVALIENSGGAPASGSAQLKARIPALSQKAPSVRTSLVSEYQACGRRLCALIAKEAIQIVNDPSSILTAFVLPILLLFLFGYAVSLDSTKIKLGIAIEDRSPEVESLLAAFRNSKYFILEVSFWRKELEQDLVAGKIRGLVVVPIDFSRRRQGNGGSSIQIIADGSEPTTANFVQNYARGVAELWLQQRSLETAAPMPVLVNIENRMWFNPSLESKNYIVPGSIAIIITMIGTLLTAMVVAREWERGTMEALMATPVRIQEIILGKLLPYFGLGLGSMFFCTAVAILVFQTPFRGSFWSLFIFTSLYLFTCLGIGLLVSTLAKSQYVAAQFALVLGFLPAVQLSGFIFEISSMPRIIQGLSYLFPARYFVQGLQSIFLAGDVTSILVSNGLALLGFSLLLFLANARITHKRLA
jgi:ABC-2 type transport system ATP-binding protein